MKTLTLLPFCTVLAAGALTAAGQAETKSASGESSTTKEVTPDSELRSTGISFSIEDETLLLTPENVKIPLSFVRTTVTPLVDETGKAVAWDQVRAGIPMTVHYTMLGDKMVAVKVVVSRYMVEGGAEVAATDEDGKKRAELAIIKQIKTAEAAEKNKTTPATGGGTIMGFEQVIAIGDGNGGDVTQYVVNNSTQFITPGGKPVAPGLVRTGGRVDVKYVENSGRKIATQLVLHGVPSQALASGTGTVQPGSPQNAVATNGSAAGTGVTTATTTTGGGGAQTAWVDQFGNIIPGTLETGFINPPVTVLPNMRPGASNSGTGGTTTAPNNNSGTGTTTGTGTPNTTNSPGTTTNPSQPVQPNATQPGTRQPSTRQPSTPSTRTSPSTGSPSTPGPAPAPGR